MLIKLLMLLLIILIALFLIIFLEPIHISVDLKFLEGLKKGHIEIKYYFIKIIKSLDEGYVKINLDTRFYSKTLKVINQSDDDGESIDTTDNAEAEDDTQTYDEGNATNIDGDDSQNQKDDYDKTSEEDSSEASGDENGSNDKLQIIKKYYPDIWELKEDILEIILSLRKIVFFDDSYIRMDLGLGDNNLTIRVSSLIWSITAPFYTLGLHTLVTPVMNECKLNLLSRLNFDVSLLVILKIILKIILNIKLVKLAIGLYKELS